MWTTKIVEISKTDIKCDVSVEFFKDGVKVNNFTFRNVSDPNSIKQLIRNQLAQYQRIDSLNEHDLIGDVDLSLPVAESPAPNQDELDQQMYTQKRQALVQAQKDLELGIIEQTEFDSLQADVKATKSTLKVTPITPAILN